VRFPVPLSVIADGYFAGACGEMVADSIYAAGFAVGFL